ncbi:hypothetical protein C8R42DRAFT_714408 [Lentinula raphanica]|nr:hypothetical protein C8R42DRAFT_714408 [Lentinula raphanica]
MAKRSRQSSKVSSAEGPSRRSLSTSPPPSAIRKELKELERRFPLYTVVPDSRADRKDAVSNDWTGEDGIVNALYFGLEYCDAQKKTLDLKMVHTTVKGRKAIVQLIDFRSEFSFDFGADKLYIALIIFEYRRYVVAGTYDQNMAEHNCSLYSIGCNDRYKGDIAVCFFGQVQQSRILRRTPKLSRDGTLSQAEVLKNVVNAFVQNVKQHVEGGLETSIMADYEAEGQESPTGTEQSRSRVSELMEEKQRLEKQLNQALVMSEVTEASSETLHQELKDARRTIAHLTVDNAKHLKLEARLLEVMKERDDLKQEREIESAKEKRTEQDIVQLHVKNSKLRSEIQQLQEELEQRDAHQKEYKGSLLQSTRAQIRRLYAKLSLTTASESIELKKSVEALCEHNEELMQYNRELEGFLADARDEIHALRQEIEEQAINVQTLEHTGHDDPQETPEDTLDADVKIMYENSDTDVHENSQQSLTILLNEIALKFFFLVGILSYWFFCAKMCWVTMSKEDHWSRITDFVSSGIIFLVFLCKAARQRGQESLYERTLVDLTSFVGVSFCVFVGWRVLYEVRGVLLLSYLDYIIGSIVRNI